MKTNANHILASSALPPVAAGMRRRNLNSDPSEQHPDFGPRLERERCPSRRVGARGLQGRTPPARKPGPLTRRSAGKLCGLKRGLSLAFLLLALGASPAHAVTITWTNTSGGNWNTAANWSPNKVPAAGDAVLITQPGDYTVLLNASASVASLTLGGGSGQQRLTNSANTLTVSGSTTVVASGVLDWAGGSVTGGGQLLVNANGVFNWSGGSMEKALTVAAGGVLNLGGTETKWVSQPLTNWGTINWAGGQFTLRYPGNLYNQPGALFDVQCDQPLAYYHGSEFIVNAGTVRKSAATGSTAVQVPLTNTGTVQVQSGILTLNGGGTLGGTFSAATGAAVRFNGGSFLSPGSSGTGDVQVTGGTLTITGPINGIALAGGSLTGSNYLTGTLNWTGGTVDGLLTVAADGVLNLVGTQTKWVSQPLTNWGTINWAGGQFTLRYPGNLYNQPGALFDVQCDQPLAYYHGSEFIVNAGTVRKSAAGGSTTIQPRFDNTGTVQVQSGILTLNGGGTLGGTFSAATGAAMRFVNGTFVLGGTLAKSGAGTVEFTGGNIQFTGPITSFDHAGAAIIGTNTVTGTLNWSGGSIDGPLTVAAGGVLNLIGTQTKWVSQPLTNWGTINWAGGQFTLRYPGNLYNQPGALFDVQCDQPLAYYHGSEFIVNAGTFRKSAVGGNTTIQPSFDNTGTVLAQSGTLNFNGVFTQTGGLTLLTNGNLAASSPLRILGGTLAGHGTITGSVTNAGTVAPGWPLGRITITGEYTQTDTGVLQIELAGMTPVTDYDRLGANTAARLAGTLEVTLANGFYPETNALFTYLTTTTRSGTFSTFLYPSNDIGLRTNYGATVASVSVINVRPVLAAIPSQNADEQAAWTCTASAADADLPAQSLTYWLTNSPPQASIDPVSRLMTWTPTEAEGPCTTNFTVCVTDNGTPPLTVRRTFAVTVNEINAPPELTPPADQALDELTPLNVRATASDPDLPANPLTFSLVSGPEGVAVSPDGEITWTPGEAQGPGEYTVQVRVTDTNAAAVNQRALSATNHFTVTVREVNQPPVLEAIPERQTNPGQTVNFTLPAHDADLPANGLSFALLSGPTNATVEAGSGVFTWRPRIGEAQTTNRVLVQVRDDGQPSLGATQEFAVVVGPLAEVRLTALGAGAEQFVFELAGQEGPDYTVQVATNLQSPDWVTAFLTNLSTPTATLTNTFPAGSADQRFYRVLIGP